MRCSKDDGARLQSRDPRLKRNAEAIAIGYPLPMGGVFEIAPSGRAKCRGCARLIAQGELRFGDLLPNPYADGDMTCWYHPLCAAYKRPESMLEALPTATEAITDTDMLERVARHGVAHRRLPRIDGAERAPTGRASCRSCRTPIQQDGWRIRLAFHEEGRFAPGGFIHLGCAHDYFETDDILQPLLHFSPELDDEAREELTLALRGS